MSLESRADFDTPPAGAADRIGPSYSMRSMTVAIPCPTPMHIVARP
jgi:hypothetical protein